MRTYKLYAGFSGTANNIANIQMVRSGRIRGIRYSAYFDAPADNANCNMELSLQPVSQLATNNTVGVIDELRHFSNLTTSGGIMATYHHQRILDFPVGAGENIYVNASITGTVTAAVTVFIDVEER